MDKVVDLAAARAAKLEATEHAFLRMLCVHLELLAEIMGVEVDGATFGDLVAATFEGLTTVMERLPLIA